MEKEKISEDSREKRLPRKEKKRKNQIIARINGRSDEELGDEPIKITGNKKA